MITEETVRNHISLCQAQRGARWRPAPADRMKGTRKVKYESEVVLGDRYRDSITGLEGTATCAAFFLHACERVTLEFIKEGEVKYESFDAPRLVHVETGVAPTTTRTGGPGGNEPGRAPAPAAQR